MKERPILFSDPMVRAILDGRKTVTRRPVDMRFCEPACRPWIDLATVEDDEWEFKAFPHNVALANFVRRTRCPFGVPGDRLWVGETHWADRGCAPDDYPKMHYRADMAEHDHCGSGVCPTPNGLSRHDGPWTPSIHMPRWASRLTMDVVTVSVGTLADIDDAEAKREGFATAAEATEAIRALYPEAKWFWRIEFRRIDR